MGQESKLKARLASDKKDTPPPGAWFAPISQCRPGSALGDARGEAPCIRKQKISPFPPGRGVGGWGQKIKLKAGAAGDKEGKPSIAFSTVAGIASAAQGLAPLGHLFGRDYKCRRRFNAGVPGAEPPAK